MIIVFQILIDNKDILSKFYDLGMCRIFNQ